MNLVHIKVLLDNDIVEEFAWPAVPRVGEVILCGAHHGVKVESVVWVPQDVPKRKYIMSGGITTQSPAVEVHLHVTEEF